MPLADLITGGQCTSLRVLPSTARSMMAGRAFLVLAGACQFGHGVGGFTANLIHPGAAAGGAGAASNDQEDGGLTSGLKKNELT